MKTEQEHIEKNDYDDTLYQQICDKCGKKHRLYTQEDHKGAEYHTNVMIVCECDNIVEFNLPVN